MSFLSLKKLQKYYLIQKNIMDIGNEYNSFLASYLFFLTSQMLPFNEDLCPSMRTYN